MPLKIEDLKTVDTYKKAIKQDVSKLSPQGGIKFWVYKDVELPTASGGKQKLPTFISLVDDNAIKTLLKGKPPICRGTCGMDKDKINFEPLQGKVPYSLLKASVPLLLGKAVHIPTGADEEGDEENGTAHSAQTTPPPAPPPAGQNLAQLNAVWKQLSQQASQRISANPAERTAFTQAMAGIPELFQAGKGAEAQKRLEELQAALKAPPPPPPNPGGAQPQAAAWKKLEEQLKQAIAQHPQHKEELVRTGAGIVEMVRAGKGQAAEQLMGKATTLLDSIAKEAAGKGTAGASQQSGASHPGIVKYRTALLQFAQARSTVQAQIAALRTAMAKQFPGEADFVGDLAVELNELSDELAAAVDEAMNGAKDEASPATDAIRSKIRKYLAELAASPVVQKVDSNPLGVQVTLGKTLGEALGRIRDAMPA